MNHKKHLEKHLNRKISDRTYFRIKQVMVKNNLPITTTNLEVVARIKVQCKKHRIPLEIGVNYYLEIANIQQSKVTGKLLYEYLQKLTIAHRTTIIRWFEDFNPDKIYKSDEIKTIFLHALIYNFRRKNAG